jgi:hypothetical protein
VKIQELRKAGMSEDFLRKYGFTLIACFLLLLLATQQIPGMYAIALILPLLIWFIYSIFVVFAKPDRRKSQLVKVAVWFVTASILLVAAWYRSEVTRNGANEIVVALKEYKTKRGSYPSKLEEIGQNSKLLRTKLGVLYMLREGKPTLWLQSSWDPFDKFDYDFEKDVWVFYPD